ncbi:MAG: VWA domain-containing protein [Clostridia bacterium]|nr:VWA domain-containing protein [Clostridia bacterium]
MSSISLDNAWLLLIAVPLILLLTIPFFITVKKDNRNGHNIASCVLHIAMAVIIAFAAAGVTVETTLTETDVFVVADVSYSSSRNLDVIDGYIEDINDNLPNNSQMGVICFGKDSTLLTPMGGEFTTVRDAEVDDSQTDIVSALQYAGARFKNNVIKRIVLITDAMQTGENGDDELKQAVDDLESRNIHVDAIYLDNNLTEDVAEVQLSGVDCSQVTYKGQSCTATVSIQASQSLTATVSLYLVNSSTGEESLLSQKSSVSLSKGTTDVAFTLPSDRDEGTYNYKVYVQSSDDYNPYNNSCSFTQEVEGAVSVLFITGSADDATEAEEMFKDTAITLDVYRETDTVPYTVSEVCGYDIIVLSNIDVSTLNNYTMLIDSIEVAVSGLGKSLIAVGDLKLSKAEDEAIAKLADMLPVNYGNSAGENNAYAIVIDCSYSMSTDSKFVSAQAAAKAVVGLLDDDDYLYIIKFHGNAEYVWSGTVGSEYNGETATEAIDNIEDKQGTAINGGLTMAGQYLSSGNYNSKNIFLFTDGEDSSHMAAAYEAASELKTQGIYTTVIDVDLRFSNQTVLENIARQGGGKYYFYNSGNPSESPTLEELLPEIISEIGETTIELSSPVSISYKNYNDSVLDGLKENGIITSYSDGLYTVNGFAVSTAKTSATTVLTTTYTKTGSSSVTTAPIYSYWNYGNGSTAAFTSAISGSWVSSRWSSAGILKTLFTDIIQSNIPEEKIDTPYTVAVNKESDSVSVEITPVEIKTGAQITVTVTSPDGTESQLTNVLFNSAAYTCSFSFDSTGMYKITVDYSYGTTVYNSYNYYVDVSYLAEYDSFTLFDASLLYKVIGTDGTVSEDGAFPIENDENEISKRTVDCTVPLLIAAVVLFAADIVIRKLKWNDIVSLFVKVDKGRKV